jgi:hypothetical protein
MLLPVSRDYACDAVGCFRITAHLPIRIEVLLPGAEKRDYDACSASHAQAVLRQIRLLPHIDHITVKGVGDILVAL